VARKTQIYSIFGQCEAAAATHFIEHHGAVRIERKDVPKEAAVNDVGKAALFAVIIPGSQVVAFNKMCDNLRA
jgi:hypothetical protein